MLGLTALFWSTRQPAPSGRLEQGAQAPLPRGGTLVASLRTEPRSFNRLVSRDVATEIVTLLTQARLVRVNRATQQVEPWLAETWTTSPDGQVFTLTLREGLQWSDGTPFTSADVAFTFKAIFDPTTKSVLASGLEVDGQPLTTATPDARTVVVTYPRPFGPGIRLLDNVVILPKHKLEAAVASGTLSDAWTPTTPPADIVGMGPFVLTRYEPGQRLTFARNPRYWRRDAAGQALPYLDGLVLAIVPNADAELLGLQSGQIDMTQQQLRAEDIATARDLERKGLVTVQEAGVTLDPDVFFFNLRPAAWAKDPRGTWLLTDAFRQAISHAVDREAYANTVYLGAAVPVHGPITPWQQGLVLARPPALSLRPGEGARAAGWTRLDQSRRRSVARRCRRHRGAIHAVGVPVARSWRAGAEREPRGRGRGGRRRDARNGRAHRTDGDGQLRDDLLQLRVE